jgi:pimeloyl-ACP methyl ester carboxylesterase
VISQLGMPAVTFALAVLGGVYGLYGGQLFLRQRKIVFHPVRELLGDPGDLGKDFEDIELPLSSGVRVHGWWIPNAASDTLVILLPGAIGNISHELSTVGLLLRAGAKVLTVDYPGYGKSGGKPGERGCYLAASAAWEYAVRERHIAAENILVFGRSLGGAVAAWLASTRECGGLILHGAMTSAPDLAARWYPILPARYFCFIRFNTLKYIRRARCPIMVMHSEADRWIPYSHGLRLFGEAPAPKRFVRLEGGHHGHEWQFTPGLAERFASLVRGEVAQWN